MLVRACYLDIYNMLLATTLSLLLSAAKSYVGKIVTKNLFVIAETKLESKISPRRRRRRALTQ